MKHIDDLTAGIFLGFMGGCVLMGGIVATAWNSELKSFKQAAIERGAAYYNPTNAVFTWRYFRQVEETK